MQIADSLQTLLDLAAMQQRLVDPAPQHSCAHGRLRPIQQPQQRAPFRAFANRLHQFEIAARKWIENHKMLRLVGGYFRKLPQRPLLRLAQITDQQGHAVAALRLQSCPDSLSKLLASQLVLSLVPRCIDDRFAYRTAGLAHPFQQRIVSDHLGRIVEPYLIS
ncbi:hypothetical protein D3C77_487820 [compost metagenome]